MKKLFIIAAAMTALLASCEKEENQSPCYATKAVPSVEMIRMEGSYATSSVYIQNKHAAKAYDGQRLPACAAVISIPDINTNWEIADGYKKVVMVAQFPTIDNVGWGSNGGTRCYGATAFPGHTLRYKVLNYGECHEEPIALPYGCTAVYIYYNCDMMRWNSHIQADICLRPRGRVSQLNN